MEVASFGDIYLISGKKYTYLVSSPEIMFFAVISDKDDPSVSTLKNLRDKKIASDPENAYRGQYCFIELTTEQFRGCLAHPQAGNSQKNFDMDLLSEKIGILNDQDKQELKNIIVDEKTGISRNLKRLVRDLDI